MGFYVGVALLEIWDISYRNLQHLNQNVMTACGLFGHCHSNLIKPHPHGQEPNILGCVVAPASLSADYSKKVNLPDCM